MTKDWFRGKTWSEEDKHAFMQKLGRSRTEFHKAQYLRIQAYELVHENEKPLYHEALELLHVLISQYPDESQLGAAYSLQSECYQALNQLTMALNATEMSIATQRKYPHSRGYSYQDFAELLLKLKLTNRYIEALDILDEFGLSEPFPITRYRTARAKALIYDELGIIDFAKTFAKQALEAAKMTKSPFRHHKKLGLVHSAESKMHQRLQQLCA